MASPIVYLEFPPGWSRLGVCWFLICFAAAMVCAFWAMTSEELWQFFARALLVYLCLFMSPVRCRWR